MYAFASPDAPLFQEHINPSLLIVVISTNPNTGASWEETMTIEHYLTEHRHDDLSPAGSLFPTIGQIMEAFDIDGYYATSLTTLIPLTDNFKTS